MVPRENKNNSYGIFESGLLFVSKPFLTADPVVICTGAFGFV